MSNSGIVRRIDDLGRIVLPKEIRRTVGIKEGDPISISALRGNIILTPYICIDDIETQLLRIKELYFDSYDNNSKNKMVFENKIDELISMLKEKE